MKIKHQSLSCALLVLLPGISAAQTYGGFAVGKTFTLRVKSKTTESYNRKDWGPYLNIMTNIPVPSGIIDLSVGQSVPFNIAVKGSLMFSGTTYGHGFFYGNSSQNWYGKNQNSGFTPAFTGYSDYYGSSSLGKNSYGTPISLTSTFTKHTPYNYLYQTVTYTFSM